MYRCSEDTNESCVSENAAHAPEQLCQDNGDVDNDPDMRVAIAASLAADRWGPTAVYFT